jgi:hypothetical protein
MVSLNSQRIRNDPKMFTQSRTVRRAIAVLAALVLPTAAVGIIRLRAHAETPLFADVHINADLLKLGAGLDADFEFDITREAGFVTGPTILGAVLRRPSIAEFETVKRQGAQAAPWLSRQIRVEFPGPELLRICYTGACVLNASSSSSGPSATRGSALPRNAKPFAGWKNCWHRRVTSRAQGQLHSRINWRCGPTSSRPCGWRSRREMKWSHASPPSWQNCKSNLPAPPLSSAARRHFETDE